MSAVYLTRKVRLLVPSAAAKPGPVLGQALGPLGLNMADFCKQFNEQTKNYEKDIILPVVLSAYSNRTFTFVVKTPTSMSLLKRCAGVEKGSKLPLHEIVGKVHIKQIYEIAKVKQRDQHLQHLTLQGICRCIIGTANSMGIQVVDK